MVGHWQTRQKKNWKEIPIPSVSASKTAEKGLKTATSSSYPGLLLSPHIILNCSSKGLTLNRNRETFLTFIKNFWMSFIGPLIFSKEIDAFEDRNGRSSLYINEESTKNSLYLKRDVWFIGQGQHSRTKMKRWNGARKISSTFRNDVTHVRGIEREGRWQDSF